MVGDRGKAQGSGNRPRTLTPRRPLNAGHADRLHRSEAEWLDGLIARSLTPLPSIGCPQPHEVRIVTWALPGAILFLLGLILLLGYFLSKKVFPSDETGAHDADPLGRSPCDGCGEAGCGGFAKALVRGGSEDPGDPAATGRELSCECGLGGCCEPVSGDEGLDSMQWAAGSRFAIATPGPLPAGRPSGWPFVRRNAGTPAWGSETVSPPAHIVPSVSSKGLPGWIRPVATGAGNAWGPALLT